jgi:hypothetical protein
MSFLFGGGKKKKEKNKSNSNSNISDQSLSIDSSGGNQRLKIFFDLNS